MIYLAVSMRTTLLQHGVHLLMLGYAVNDIVWLHLMEILLLQIQQATLCTILQHKNNESMPSFLFVVWISLEQRDLKMSSDLISVCSALMHLTCINDVLM